MNYHRIDCKVCLKKEAVLMSVENNFDSVTVTIKKCSCGEQMYLEDILKK